MTEQTKVCTGCSRELPLSAFGRAKNAPDGLAYRCKDCTNAAKRDYMHSRRKKHLVYSNPDLARFTPRQLIEELRARGYHGELKITQSVKV